MKEEKKVNTPETNPEMLTDEALENAAGGFGPRKTYTSETRCSICGKTRCIHNKDRLPRCPSEREP